MGEVDLTELSTTEARIGSLERVILG